MNLLPLLLVFLLTAGLMACHKQSVPAQAEMDAEARQKAIAVREAADKEILALKEAASAKEAADKAALVPAPTK